MVVGNYATARKPNLYIKAYQLNLVMTMKGLELPINVLVIVAVAVIVLLGIISLYFVGIGPFQRDIAREAAKSDACSILIRNCTASPSNISVSYDVNGDGNITLSADNLLTLCSKYFGASDVNSCRRVCNCPGY
jgi:hypothetical protein